ncbi:MAG: acetyl-CoA carboxylase biotin carboxyl carrier protein subunit [Chloroflexi bacterium]|nr:acetyl-CoA carboxylase biotin carboxyl carrier protein subunit [Chloroflexota bacterium]
MSRTVRVRIGERWYAVEVGDLDSSPVRVIVDGVLVEVDTQLTGSSPAPPDTELRPGSRPESQVAPQPQAPAEPAPQVRVPSAVNVFRSPMPGVIVSVAVSEGDQVVTGDEVCVLEAMKMQQVLRADWTGVVKTVHVRPGQQVLDGDPIVDLE